MFSEALLILDHNTERYMIEESKRKLEEAKRIKKFREMNQKSTPAK